MTTNAEAGVPDIVLASASPRRADVLRVLGLRFRVQPMDLDETPLPDESPTDLVTRLAAAKAEAAGSADPGALVIGGDTVVVEAGRVLCKPEDPEDAVRMLLGLSGGTHHVVTGVAVAHRGRVSAKASRTEVAFRPVTEPVVRAYVDTKEPLDKAGGYGIQGRGAALVAGIRGDYYTVVGLPVAPLLELFEVAGWVYTFDGLRPGTPAS